MDEKRLQQANKKFEKQKSASSKQTEKASEKEEQQKKLEEKDLRKFLGCGG